MAPPDLGEVCICVMCYSKDVLSNTLRTAEQPLQEYLGGNILVANTGISHTWRRFGNAQREREVSLLEVSYA